MKIGLIREEKALPDRRVALLPEQCLQVQSRHPHVQFLVQSSPHRCVPDADYQQVGIPVTEGIENCDVLLGIKEVPVASLIPGKMYLFFSHTIKKQQHNRPLLRATLENNITLVDYECLTDADGQRLVAFGRYAGIVGAYNAFWTYGKKYGYYDLKRAYQCRDRAEMEGEYAKITLPPVKIALTGSGRVAKGALEVLQAIGIRQVTPLEVRHETFREPVFALLGSRDYHTHRNGNAWDTANFYRNPQQYLSSFQEYAQAVDLLIAAAYWNPLAPVLFTKSALQDALFRVRVVADITCDMEGSIPCTVRPTTIADPVYDYDRSTGQIKPAFSSPDHVSVMAIDNLPCELPLDASRFFGEQLMQHVLPHLLQPANDTTGILARGTIASGGQLTERFRYLEAFVKGETAA